MAQMVLMVRLGRQGLQEPLVQQERQGWPVLKVLPVWTLIRQKSR
jgi:hypothetical protein